MAAPEAPFFSSKLRLARLLNGWSKADLADRLQVTRQFMHALEVGEKGPSADFLPALALVLRVHPSFFNTPLGDEVRESECHFRSRRSMPDKLAEQVIAHATAVERLVRHLEKSSLKLPPVNFPAKEVDDEEGIERAAAECRQHWKLGTGPIANMCRVLENAGAVVTFFNSPRPEVDALSISRARPLVVRNTLKESPGRLRFDLAHECGHLVIHQGEETGDQNTERQADRFASAFLMPPEDFAREVPAMPVRLDWHTIYSLKVRWRVSAKAVLRRARDLGRINEVQYAAGNRYLHQTGQARVERYDDRLPMEEPELLSTAIHTYRSSFKTSIAELASALGMTPSLLGQVVAGGAAAANDDGNPKAASLQ